jgi:hypothetical protein
MSTVEILAIAAGIYFVVLQPSASGSFFSGRGYTRINVPGVGSYQQTPAGTSIQLAQALANPLAQLFNPTGPAIGPAPANSSPYDPSLYTVPNTNIALPVESTTPDPTLLYPWDPGTIPSVDDPSSAIPVGA